MDDDILLIQQHLKGDPQAFKILVNKYKDRIHNLIYSITGDRENVEDLAQDVFMKTFISIEKLKNNSQFYPWLYRVTVNLCIDELRKKKIRRFLSLQDLPEWFQDRILAPWRDKEPSQEISSTRQELSDIIQWGMNKLSPKHRIVITLRHIEELSYEEMAKVLSCSTGTVKSRLFRARRALAKIIEPFLEREE
ncbi:MAG: RNA polymerase sigma factor [Fidelibacterota bacterium]